MRYSPEIAVAMLVRNIIAQPVILAHVRSKIDTNYLPNSDNSVLIRRLIEAAGPNGRLNEGLIESVLEAHPNQQFARPIRLRAVAEDRETVDGYLDCLTNYAELERLRILIANIHLDLSSADADVDVIKRDLANGIVQPTINRGLRDIGAFAAEAGAMLTLARSGDRPGRGAGFGFELDKYWWLDPGCISIVAGRPGSGKTSLVTSSIVNGASPEHPEAFFSIEMPGYSIASRIAAALESVPLSELMKGTTSYEDYARTMSRLTSLGAGSGIFVDEDVVTMDDILYRCMALPIPPRVVWIDYGEKVDVEPGRAQRRDLELGYVYTQAKVIAKRLKCHVVVLAQLGRDVDLRADRWPQMSDISQSGAAEKDGDYVVLLMRPEYYYSKGLSCRLLLETDRNGVCYVIVSKSRNGATETVRVKYDAQLMKFEEYGTQPYYFGGGVE